MKKNNITFPVFAAATLLLFFTISGAETLIDLNDFDGHEVYSAGFNLSTPTDLNVEATILTEHRRDLDPKLSNAWILNAQTRQVVWQVSNAEEEDRDGYVLTMTDKINLDAGNYEVYYATFPDDYGFFSWHGHRHRGLFAEIFDLDRENYDDRYYSDLYIKISGNGKALTADEMKSLRNNLKEKAVASISNLDDESYDSKYFSVKQPAEIEIYAIGEFSSGEPFDFGWITNVNTRERVWEFSRRRSDHAGGAQKNKVYRNTITLEPGSYQLSYVTDDSHSGEKWNMAPPFDPEFWGITVWPADESAAKSLTAETAEFSGGMTAIAEINKVRDDEFISKGFTLKQDMDLHIYALGEGDHDEMYDYAWIVSYPEHKVVWRMDYHDTYPAGGDEKNRLFDDLVHFGKGNYLVHYISDDSHAYHSWNSGEPFDKKAWGVTLSAPESQVKSGMITEFNEEEDKSVLVKMTRVGDHEKQKTRFVLEKEQFINIYAIGEGQSGEMYDYAWIEDANTGKTMWEMTYHQTDRAGGARKNRVINDQIRLPAGTYIVVYKTDGSHSFGRWNEQPPNDPGHWGITITLAAN